MSATNKTTNLELPVYIGSDKPTYLGDWNSTMEKIDNFSGRTSTAITEVENVAQGAVEAVGHMQSEVTEVSSTLDLLNGRISALETNDASQDTKITKLNNDVADLQTSGVDTESRLTKLESQSDLNTGNITTLQGNVSSLQTSQTAILNAITTLDDKTDGLDTRVTALEEGGTGGGTYPILNWSYVNATVTNAGYTSARVAYAHIGDTMNDALITTASDINIGSFTIELPFVAGKTIATVLNTAQLNNLLGTMQITPLHYDYMMRFYVATMSKNFDGWYPAYGKRNVEPIVLAFQNALVTLLSSTSVSQSFTVNLNTLFPFMVCDQSHTAGATGSALGLAKAGSSYVTIKFTLSRSSNTWTPGVRYGVLISAQIESSITGTVDINGISTAMNANMAEMRFLFDFMISFNYSSYFTALKDLL